jgi:hypothetical protein
VFTSITTGKLSIVNLLTVHVVVVLGRWTVVWKLSFKPSTLKHFVKANYLIVASHKSEQIEIVQSVFQTKLREIDSWYNYHT